MRRGRSRGPGLLLAVALCGGLPGQAVPSGDRWREERPALRQRIRSADPRILAETAEALAAFQREEATRMLLQVLERLDGGLARQESSLADLRATWEAEPMQWRQIRPDQRERLARYEQLQTQLTAQHGTVLRHLRARQRAIVALGGVEDQASLELVAREVLRRRGARAHAARAAMLEAMALQESPLVEQALVDLLQQGTRLDLRLKVRALTALTPAHRSDPGELLLEALAASHPWQVRAAALEALGIRREVQARPALEGILETGWGRLRWDAALTLEQLGGSRSRSPRRQALERAHPCLDLQLCTRNVVFLIAAGYSMAEPLSPGAPEGPTRFQAARNGVLGFLRSVLVEYRAAPGGTVPPFRFNLCYFDSHPTLFQASGMVSIPGAEKVAPLEQAMRWLQGEGLEDRVAAGETNLAGALERCLHLQGYDPGQARSCFEEQPDTIVILMSQVPTAGVVRYERQGGPAAQRDCWARIREHLSWGRRHRHLQVACICLGEDTRTARELLALADPGRFLHHRAPR